MSNYTFADLLNIFFRFQQDSEQRNTQEHLAREVGVSLRAINNWFSGNYAPRSPKVVLRLAHALGLTAFQADLMLYSINPDWVHYGTPREVLDMAEVVRYREQDIQYRGENLQRLTSVSEIEREWRVFFEDRFDNNHNHWGLGTKNDNTGELVRSMEKGRYVLSLRNLFHGDVFLGGDSYCFAPDNYYVSVWATMVQGDTVDDGYGLIFEEISDACQAMVRVREQLGQVSVIQTFNGGDLFNIYVRRAPVPCIHAKAANKLAILALGQEHWFYINDHLIGQQTIPRLPLSRLDLGIIAGRDQHVICHYQDFRVYVPPATRIFPMLEQLIGMPLE